MLFIACFWLLHKNLIPMHNTVNISLVSGISLLDILLTIRLIFGLEHHNFTSIINYRYCLPESLLSANDVLLVGMYLRSHTDEILSYTMKIIRLN